MIVGIYGMSGASRPLAATALKRMAAGADGLHRGRARTLLATDVAVAVYPRAGRECGESLLERDDVLIIAAGHLLHPKFEGEGPPQIVSRLLDAGALSDGLAQCAGEFAVVVVDKHSGELTLATDYLGIRPLFYAVTNCGVLFGSDVWPIFDSGCVARELDYDGLASWILFHHPQDTSTLFRQIKKVAPGTVLRCRGGTVTATDYRHARTDAPGDGRDLADQIHDIVSRTCRSLTRGQQSMAILLSGGFDSRYVACLMRSQGIECTAYTVPFESGDAEVAPVVAARLDMPLRTVPLPGSLDDAHGEPEGWSAAGFPIGKSVTCLPFERFDIALPAADGFVG
ncbi:MAG: asparagine synthase-related protein, partial [Longimicrobiales bacterium]